MRSKIILAITINIAAMACFAIVNYYAAIHGLSPGAGPIMLLAFVFISLPALKFLNKQGINIPFALTRTEDIICAAPVLLFVLFFIPSAYTDPSRDRRILLLSIFEALMILSNSYYYVRYFFSQKKKVISD